MNKITTIFFDWSGTLFNDVDVSYISTKATLKRFGVSHFSKKAYREEFVLPAWKFYRKYIEHYSIDEIDAYYFEHFKSRAGSATLYDGVKPLLNKLVQWGYDIHIFSTVPTYMIEDLCRKNGIFSSIKGIHGSVRDKSKMLGGIVKKMGKKKEEVLYIGDMSHDMDAAKAAGVTSGAVTFGYQNLETLLEKAPDLIWNSHRSILRTFEKIQMSRKSKEVVVKKYPVVTVGGLICHEDKVFLVQTHKWGHTFGIPGGKIEYGETSIDALKREIKEETGLRIKNVRFICVQDSIYSHEFYKRKAHFLLMNYVADSFSKKFKLNEESETGIWVDPKVALRLKLNKPTRLLIESYLKEV